MGFSASDSVIIFHVSLSWQRVEIMHAKNPCLLRGALWHGKGKP